jgi:hypothetical protein
MNFNPSKLAEYLKPVSKQNLLFSVAIGGALGAFTAMIANACLLEITLNGFFTIVSFHTTLCDSNPLDSISLQFS